MKEKIVSETGLVQVPSGNDWILGFRPTQQTFCLGKLTKGLADEYRNGEQTVIRFKDGVPSEVTMTKKEIDNYDLQPGEVKVVFGSYFVNG